MKKLIFSTAFVVLGAFVMAQSTDEMAKREPAHIEQKRADHLKQMQSELGLSDLQVKQIRSLYDENRRERSINRVATETDRRSKVADMRARKLHVDQEMRKILTPSQFQKWETIKAEKMQHRKNGMRKNHEKKMQLMKK